MVGIKIVNLTKKYKDIVAVNSLNVEIEQGELLCLLGLNGAGKTTLIKMLSAILKPTSGDAFLLGNSIVSDTQKVKEIIGVLPQETAIAPNLSVLENLELICGVYGFDKERTKIKIESTINSFGLEQVKNKKASKLSGGWQRRLSFAMALICDPKILFLDEPTVGLDVIARNEIWDIIKGIKGKVTVILTTHYMEEAEKLSDRVAVMKNGNIVTLGTVSHLKELTKTDSFDDTFVSIIKGVE